MVPAHVTTMPPVSQTNRDVGSVSSPGCSRTMRGLLLRPAISQMARPNLRASFAQAEKACSVLISWVSAPQCEKCLRLMYPSAPRATQSRPRSSLLTTAMGMPPPSRTSWIASTPSPPAPPHTSTTSPFWRVLPCQRCSMR